MLVCSNLVLSSGIHVVHLVLLYVFILLVLCCDICYDVLSVKPGVNSGGCEGQAVHVSYNTPTVLLLYTVKFCKTLFGSDRGKKKST
jgi:hypothetical protein